LRNDSIALELPSSSGSKDGEEKPNVKMHQNTLKVGIGRGMKML
jgi:hypothetical protein